MAGYNSNVLLHSNTTAPVAQMGLATSPVATAEMERRRRRRGCKHGRTSRGRCRKG